METLTPLSSITVTGQLVQTGQGPRIILQGLGGVVLGQQQLAQIHQQVKTQLETQQFLARQEGKVPPTKVSITPSGTFTANLPQSVIKQGQFIIKDGRKVLVLPQNAWAAHQVRQGQLFQQSIATAQKSPELRSRKRSLN